jgi:hypothetical protein
MIDVENLKQYQIERPDRWSLFGDAEDFDNLPVLHKDQIFFLDKTATDFLYQFLKVAKLIANNDNPFSKNNFKTVEHYTQMDNENGLKIGYTIEQYHLKKKFFIRRWLYSHNMENCCQVCARFVF